MTPTFLLLIVGCGLGIVQLLAGLALGLWLRRPGSDARHADLVRAQRLAASLQGLTQDLGKAVSQHRSRFEAAQARLAAEPVGGHLPTTDLVVGVVSEVLRANQQLQAQLTRAEDHIVEQAAEIESYLTRAMTDSLTELPNRRALDEQLARRLEEYRKRKTPFSLLMIDLDHFKQINDTFGHQTGDMVLRDSAKALTEALRRDDFVARYGGEEFAVVLSGTGELEAEHAVEKATQGLEALSEKYVHFGRPITASSGLAAIRPGETVESLLRRADAALYAAKHDGRDCTYLHTGTECRRLQPGGEQSAGEHAAMGGEPISAELAGACHELRSAMLELSAERADWLAKGISLPPSSTLDA